MTPRNDATAAQVRAADPHSSTWLAANAGSGKTRVLTDRVARLLLTGVEPQHILCLTYTKAAASEMQNRLFQRLGSWAMLDADTLRAQLLDLGEEGTITIDRLAHARTLFARAIETPGGLKIQTIHSFCAGLLRRFPLEAGVSPQFSEMEERAAELLRADVLEQMADAAPALLAQVAYHLDESNLSSFTAEVVGNADTLATHPGRDGIWAAFGLPNSYDYTDPRAEVLLGNEADLIANLVPHLLGSGKNDQKAGTALKMLDLNSDDALAKLEDICLFKSGANAGCAKIGSFPTKALQKNIPDILPHLDALMRRIEDTRPRRLGLFAAYKSLALHDFSTEFLRRYSWMKQLRGALDFDDLIRRARNLLTDPAVAQWVLYRLDGGIDHILVDEAQDTSPEQWAVIEALAQEFTSGDGARTEVERTIFVVGDKKQSIYSFQGADPNAFDRMQEEFRDRLAALDAPFQSLELQYSFRSSAAILHSVDHVFQGDLSGPVGQQATHKAFKTALPGRVDVWPFFAKEKEPEKEGNWFDPVDRPAPSDPEVLLARQIAAEIRRMLDTGAMLPDEAGGQLGQRPVRAGDFLILVQRRSALFAEIIRACKAEGLPIAGADRLKVGAELAVRDLGALLAFLALPEDDLALATALRSPLFGWSEQQLYTLAHHRPEGHLWPALRDNPAHADTIAVLRDLRNQADFLRPYDLIERILTVHRGRHNMLSRLGAEAEDGINALLTQALRYEAQAVADLTGFLSWMQADDLEIKRQIDDAGDEIRVMTVHGSKGLEAPIVILPDTGKRRAPDGADLIPMQGATAWKVAKPVRTLAMSETHDALVARQTDERFRLLYVAMTRAEKWLIVAGAKDAGTWPDSWYSIVEKALIDQGAAKHDTGFGLGYRLEQGDWQGLPVLVQPKKTTAPVVLPAYATQPPPDPVMAPKPITPSDLGGAKALAGAAGQDEDTAKTYGHMVHTLLEVLPQHPRARWSDIAPRLIANQDSALAVMAEAEAIRVLDMPALNALFAKDTLEEVALSAQLNGKTLHGVVDRLIVAPDAITVIDFKTNRTIPDNPDAVPEGILRQMAAYHAALAQIYPKTPIHAALLWTAAATLMELPDTLLRDALMRTGLA